MLNPTTQNSDLNKLKTTDPRYHHDPYVRYTNYAATPYIILIAGGCSVGLSMLIGLLVSALVIGESSGWYSFGGMIIAVLAVWYQLRVDLELKQVVMVVVYGCCLFGLLVSALVIGESSGWYSFGGMIIAVLAVWYQLRVDLELKQVVMVVVYGCCLFGFCCGCWLVVVAGLLGRFLFG
eukprot:TRINITY_DN7155_c0_g1_i1.p1 TRINITY_DN7155_c0_g1~~TRINITY_DN7155_c0_g1_i1.p1  ORF type:complete len:179 (-),score=12.55 TRINITY_DN7155_c0_g1_i1:155-691(-)